MALTNPNKVVTEERLSEFYGQILPYMGGMPEVLVNKFARGDLYSTDEKIIGCWIDGKPLYQKTFVDVLPPVNTDNEIQLDFSVDTFVRVDAFFEPANGIFFNTEYVSRVKISGSQNNFLVRVQGNNNARTSNPNKIIIHYENINDTTDWDGRPIFITIQYTKTTDEAGSFNYANENDYSTDEKVVGTWIDSKPIYQKTFNVTNDVDVTTDGTDAYFSVDIASANYIDTVVNLDSVVITSNSVIKPCYASYQNDTLYVYRSYVNSAKTRVIFVNNRIVWNQAPIKLTVQYTKTTD